MSTQGMSRHYVNLSRGNDNNNFNGSLDLLGIRERRANRMAESELERNIRSLKLISELENTNEDLTLSRELKKLKEQTLIKIKADMGLGPDSDIGEQQKLRTSNVTKEESLNKEALANPNMILATTEGLLNKARGMQYDKLPTTMTPASLNVRPNYPGVNAPTNTGFGNALVSGQIPTAQSVKRSGGIDPTTGFPLPDTEIETRGFGERPRDVIPLNQATIDSVLSGGSNIQSPLYGPLTPFQAAANATPPAISTKPSVRSVVPQKPITPSEYNTSDPFGMGSGMSSGLKKLLQLIYNQTGQPF